MLLGRVPAERHLHYDADGELTGWTVVEREPEWLDEDVAQMVELAEVEARSCPGCGWHEDIADDPDSVFSPHDHICPVCAGRAQWDRHLQAEDDRHAEGHKGSPAAAPRPGDGRWTRMTLLSPEEIARRRGDANGDTH